MSNLITRQPIRSLLAFLFSFSFLAVATHAQHSALVKLNSLPRIEITHGVSLHIVSPEPIQKVDVSSHALAGDLLEANVLRLKVIPDSAYLLLRTPDASVVVTVIGESFIAQYQLCFVPPGLGLTPTLLNIMPEHCQPLDISGVDLSTPAMKVHALSLLKSRMSAAIRSADGYGIRTRLNQVYTLGEYIFLDLSFENRTGLKYNIDELRFKIEDKKITKATNVQSAEVKPVWQLYPNTPFKRNYRNIFVLKKMTFPENKVLNIELTEKQISGRTVTLKVKYGDILKADTF
ncbi:conjugative transposon protein TraN [Pedobacter chinensis]|uniref:Conjugative transposon protein TraN n=1 Tax=Pedobacter chinensis TaxID=2282421 RepID=A0A369PUE6_9SPHI|nr:conjugative transposon protein TraN [Pedobacter chinensis]RDC54339.1 conjugative transposon protein TraN [Pedobacter chinensis]